jgi:hypothetical protein
MKASMESRSNIHRTTQHLRIWGFVASLACAAACVGCSTGSQEDDRSNPAAPPTRSPAVPIGSNERGQRSRDRAPLVVTVDGPASVSAGSTIELSVGIERRWATSDPVELAVRVPDGARLIDGASTEILDPAVASVARKLRLYVERVPEADLIVRADLSGTAYGAHAVGTYRFGRPEPRLSVPPGRPVVVRGRTIGKAIPIPASGSRR